MISAPILELDGTGQRERNLGSFEFAQLPAPGDRVLLPAKDGRALIYKVVYVDYSPLRPGEKPGEGWAMAVVNVTYLEGYW